MCINSSSTEHPVLRALIEENDFWKVKELLESHLITDGFSVIAKEFAMGNRAESWVISILTNKDFI